MQSAMTDVATCGAAAAYVLDPPRRASAGPFTVHVASTVEELEALAPEWLALERLSGANAVFQSFHLTRVWARHFLAGRGARQRLHVAAVRDNGRAVLILPLVVGGSPWLRTARLAGDPIAQYSELLADPAAQMRAAFDAALRSAAEAGIDAIVFRRVRRDSHLLRAASAHLRAPTAESAAPYADLGPFADYEAFQQSLSKKVRQGLRNRRNHLDRAGGVAFELLAGGPDARRALADAIDMKRKWLIQRGAISSAFVDASTRECLLDLAEDAGGWGAVVLRLLVNGEPAAIRFGFEHQGTHFSYLGAYDERFANLSPGKMLVNFYVARFKERRIERIDMLPPGGRHKSDWCRDEMGVADYTLPLSGAGRSYAALYQERLRPALQRSWQRLPDALRTRAAARFVSI